MEFKIEKFTFNNDRPLIYFLVDNGEVVYVGKTVNFLARIVSHQRAETKYNKWVDGKLVERYVGKIENGGLKKFNEVYIKEVESKDMLTKCERKYIKKFLPKYNTCAYATRQQLSQRGKDEEEKD